MTKELYINGQLCDLEDTPSLIFQSPVFNDLDVIQSNRSAEINLPLTPRNRKAFGLIDRIDILDDSAVYRKHSAAYYLGGFPIFTRGYAMVTDVTDTINITLVWGNIDNFQPLFDASLRDLREQIIEVAGADYVEWNKEVPWALPSDTALAGFIQIDFGAGRNINYSHPSVQVSAILDAIQKYHGITIENITRLSQTSDKHPMIVPLVSKNSGPDSWYSDRFEASSAHYGNSGSSNTALKFREIVSDKRSILTDQNYAIDVSSTKTIDVSIISYSSAVFFPGMRAASASPTLKLRGDSGNGTSEVLLSVEGIDTGSGIRFGVKPDLFNNVEVNVEDYDTVRWILSNAVTIDATTSDEFTVAAKFIITPHFDDIQFPSPFPIAENLPDMTHAEFLSALMTMAGLFAYPDSSDSNTIHMMSPDQFYNSTETIDYDYRTVGSEDDRTPNTQTDRRIVDSHLDATIQDWSRKVILNDRGEIWRPEGTEFTMGDYAQTNTLDYDNDEDAEMLNTQGIISIDNENIERENELVSLDFSASTNRTGWNPDRPDRPFAFVPCYEEQTVNGAKKVNYSAPSARILADVNTTIEDGNGTVGRYRHGLFPRTMYFGGSEGIVAKRYADYQRILKRFRMITVYVKLTVADICNLDYTRRVYLDVYGCYFAIYSVTTGEDGICECKLIKL
ncbi:hypothetical protein A5CBH24_03180 [Alistipes communis]|jgi:hypothetical protein|uniref:Uncharacterized protein n=1 Tax=Alistipes communis TaxID=2585118 RepID=A0A4Y1WQP2_9BACT|nr:hypothetical protein [Alistipes communis]BBL03005.1 hypothetical protein A5CBH24_03180 [Alistipes communis]